MRNYVGEKEGDGVIEHKEVVAVERCDSSPGARVRYLIEDGQETVEEADLIIGADGVKSVVRRALFIDDERYRPLYRLACSLTAVHKRC